MADLEFFFSSEITVQILLFWRAFLEIACSLIVATDESTNRLRAEANAKAASLSRASSGGSRAGGVSRAPSGISRASGTDGVLCVRVCAITEHAPMFNQLLSWR